MSIFFEFLRKGTIMKNTQLFLLIISCLFFASCADSEEPKRDNHKKDTVAEWLFVQTSPEAKMTSDTTLVMLVTREIFAFTDRPNRKCAYATANEFVSLWEVGGSFKDDPPNAVLTWAEGNKAHEAEVVLTGASALAHGRAISFEVKLAAGEVPSGKMQYVSLFVDRYPLPDGNQLHFAPPPRTGLGGVVDENAAGSVLTTAEVDSILRSPEPYFDKDSILTAADLDYIFSTDGN